MTDSRVAHGLDRLPWLPDEPARVRKPIGNLLGWVVAAMLVVAGASYWLGIRAGVDEFAPSGQSSGQPSATMPLPEARQAEANDQVQPVTAAEIPRVPEPEVRRLVERSPVAGRQSWRPLPRTVPKEVAERVNRTIATDELGRVAQTQNGASAAVPQAPSAPPVVNTQRVRLWPARTSVGSAGRVVQIGAFGTRLQAKRGWWHMVRAYPGVRRLPAVVVEARNSRGRPFYRFQIGTTSQAHSEVLCQRMEKIRFSCAVAGLPGARKAVER